MKIRDLLKIKGRQVVSIESNEHVSAAIEKLAHYNRGSLPVCNDKGELVGIITERDIVRKCFDYAGSFRNGKVQEVMTKKVAISVPGDDLDYAISVMKQKRIRHLPIVENGIIVGMVSMRDLLDVQLEETKAEIRYNSMLPRRTKRPLI